MITWILVYWRNGINTIIHVKDKRTMSGRLLLSIIRFEAYLWLNKEVPLDKIEIY